MIRIKVENKGGDYVTVRTRRDSEIVFCLL
jgi:hypothetical protein